MLPRSRPLISFGVPHPPATPSVADARLRSAPAGTEARDQLVDLLALCGLDPGSFGAQLVVQDLVDGPPAVDETSFAIAYASPGVRKLARELGVDLGSVKGSGNKGRITKEDVEAAAKLANWDRASMEREPVAP